MDATAERVQERGDALLQRLRTLSSPLIRGVRGRGLMLGVELCHAGGEPAGDVAGGVLVEMLKSGVIMLAGGPHGNVLAFTPPFDLADEEMDFVVDRLQRALDR